MDSQLRPRFFSSMQAMPNSPGSSQGMPDGNQTVVPTLHNFTYDVYFYGDNLGLA
jgi:hypothetical protein